MLADEAELSRDVWQWMEVQGNVPRATRGPLEWTFDVDQLNAAPIAARRFALWRAMSEAAHDRTVSFDHVEAAIRLAESDGPAAFDGPGQRVERNGRSLVLRGRPPGTTGRTVHDRSSRFQYPLVIPGEVTVPQAGCVVSAERWPAATSAGAAGNLTAVVRSDLSAGPWLVRNRRPGDWFRPVGLGGRKKLQDFFVDRKVAQDRRDLVPLVVDETGRIVWVAGYGIDEAFQVTDASQAVILLRLKLLGGTA